MAQLKHAKALAAELEAAVASGGEPDSKLVARMIGHSMISLASIADALARAHPATDVKADAE